MTIYNNYKYYLTLVDDYRRVTWTHLLSSKTNALQVIKASLTMVQNQFKTIVKIIRPDNGLEFTSSEAISFFQSQEITPLENLFI